MLTDQAQNRTPPSRERGSLVLALCLVLTIATLSIIVVARMVTEIALSEEVERSDAARNAADAGIADALATIDAEVGATGTQNLLVGSGAIAGQSYDWQATRLADTQWRIESTGIAAVSRIQATTTASRENGFPYGIAVNQRLTLTSGAFVYRSVDARVSVAAPSGAATLAANQGVYVNGPAGGNEQRLFGSDGLCVGSGCTNIVRETSQRNALTPATPTDYQACPASGTFSGAVNGGAGLAYLCDEDVRLSGVTTVVDGPLIIVVTAGNNVTMDDGATANWEQPAADFQLLVQGNASIDFGTGIAPTQFFGILYAPDATLNIAGPVWQQGGVVDVDRIAINPNVSGEFRYDMSAQAIPQGKWSLANWTERAL